MDERPIHVSHALGSDLSGLVLDDRYQITRKIGTGGMARVVLAHDERLGRKVAIKRLHADSPAETARRFDREARLGASLTRLLE